VRGKYAKFILLAPAIIIILATTTFPLVNALTTSFQEWRLNRSPEPRGWVGFDNYSRAFSDEYFINSVFVTIFFTIISVALSVIIGLAMAVLLQKKSLVNTIIKTLLIFPFAVSATLKGFSWRFMLNPTFGVYDQILDFFLPFARETVWLADSFWALFFIALSEVWGWAPLIALMFIGALGSVSPEIIEAARLDGATAIKLFRYITLPIIAPVILIVTLLKTIFSLKMFDQVVTMTGGGPGRSTQTLNFFVYEIGFKNLDMGYASALAILLTGFLAIFAFLYVRTLLSNKRGV
jgi:multiple sugar transport system permease protein